MVTTTRSIRAATFAKARRLGEEMISDPLIRPYLKDVAQYMGYARFRNAHRAHWEQSRHFELHYQERIFSLADREATVFRTMRSDSMLHWDVWYERVVHPITAVVWNTWESANHLEGRYLEALLTSGLATPSEIQDIVRKGKQDTASMDEMPTIIANQHAGHNVVANVISWFRNAAM